MHAFPSPSELAQQHSRQLVSLIHQAIDQAGGWMPFDEYMRMALYQPGFGYYSAGAKKFGAAGDFITAPELSELFGNCLAQPMQQLFHQCADLQKNPEILELGAGQGKLAKQLLLSLRQAGITIHRYCILEVSATLRQQQQEYLSQSLPVDLMQTIVWLDELPAQWHGVIVANEVFDALPIKIHQLNQNQAFELGIVTGAEGDLQLRLAAQPNPALQRVQQAYQLPEGYLFETCPAAQGLMTSLADCLQQGLVLLIDYGFDAATYYHPQRRQGTLMCHYRHYAHSDALYFPGLQDITAHVNFSAIAQSAVDHDMQLVGYVTQAHFLMDAGLLNDLSALQNNPHAYIKATQQVNIMTSPAEMGELFKVIAFDKYSPIEEYLGFRQADQSFRL